MKPNHRRDFLKKSILGLSGAALIPGSIKAFTPKPAADPSQALPLRTLGKTGLKIPLLSMGTGDTNNPALVQAALEKGVRLLGTSTYYGNGNNETMLGGVLKNRPRESYLIATSTMPKGTDHQKGLFTDPEAGTAFQSDIENSMKRLGVDYLDILFLPFAAKRESVFFEPLLRVMEDFKKSGKARFIGIATHSYVDEAIRAAADTGIYDVAMAAYNFRLQKMQEVNEAVQYGASAGLGIIAMKTMAGGFWDQNRTQPISSKAALKWVAQNENVHTLMSGMTNFEELQNNITLMGDLKITDDELKDLKLAQAGQGLYCLQCRKCSGQCPHDLDIPTIMRSFMYAYGYRNLDHAQQTLNLADLSGKPCEQCDVCQVECAVGFDVKSKIENIARLRDVPRDFLLVRS
ncbi:MAG: aldo/keto reductase [Bacteroidales bacterium]|nr:aldo/keto reductase [Bacteroidales bacterium]